MVERFDSVVIGGGMSGLPLALRAARHGWRGDLPYSEIGRAIRVHPALAEGVNAAAGGVHRASRT